MPIYDIFETKESEAEKIESSGEVSASSKDRFFSSLTARVLFFLLLLADIGWSLYNLLLVLTIGSLHTLTLGKISVFQKIFAKAWIGLKRSGICGVSLFIALFSPALGIMVACTYFLMYDKSGIQEVVPRSLQDQFQEFMK